MYTYNRYLYNISNICMYIEEIISFFPTFSVSCSSPPSRSTAIGVAIGCKFGTWFHCVGRGGFLMEVMSPSQ